MPVVAFFLFPEREITTFTMTDFHFRLGGKSFSVHLPLPVWLEMILISFLGLMDPKT